MPKNMNDVNEMRELAAESCGVITRWAEDALRDDDRELECRLLDCTFGGTVVQYARDLEAWVALRTRIEALEMYHDLSSQAMSALRDVIDIMDELEGP